jgi:replicative DNA helicase
MSAPNVLQFPQSSEDDELDRLADQLPTPEELAVEQDEQARESLYEDRAAYPRFLVPSLDELTGPFAPGEVVVVGAREGQGKSVFCLNMFDDLVRQDITTLLIGTEQAAKILKQKHVCLNLGLSARKLLKPTQSEMASGEYDHIQAAVDEGLKWFLEPEIRRTAIYANTPHIDRAVITKWVGGGFKKYGVRVAIIDHIDHVNHGSGVNPVHELTQTVRLALKLATDLNITIVLASQLKRAPDQLMRYQPPQATDLAGSSDKERSASLILGLWRPLRDDIPLKDAREMAAKAKAGNGQEETIYKPMTMGVKVLKDRLGDAPGKHIELHLGRGNKLEMDEASTHGIKTNRSVG